MRFVVLCEKPGGRLVLAYTDANTVNREYGVSTSASAQSGAKKVDCSLQHLPVVAMVVQSEAPAGAFYE